MPAAATVDSLTSITLGAEVVLNLFETAVRFGKRHSHQFIQRILLTSENAGKTVHSESVRFKREESPFGPTSSLGTGCRSHCTAAHHVTAVELAGLHAVLFQQR
jgi:hypothetical protein